MKYLYKYCDTGINRDPIYLYNYYFIALFKFKYIKKININIEKYISLKSIIIIIIIAVLAIIST